MHDFLDERNVFLNVKEGLIAELIFYSFTIIDKKISQGEIV